MALRKIAQFACRTNFLAKDLNVKALLVFALERESIEPEGCINEVEIGRQNSFGHRMNRGYAHRVQPRIGP